MKLCSKCGAEKVQIPSGKWKCRPCEREWRRGHYQRNIDAHRERMRKRMKELRADASKGEMVREISRRAYRNGGAEKQRERIARIQAEEPFRWRAQLLRRTLGWPISEDDLKALWDAQGGLCGLTGQPMDIATADIDHIVPRSRGGSNDLSNLRWTTRAANQAKGDMLDEELVALCAQVAEHIGRMIMEAAA